MTKNASQNSDDTRYMVTQAQLGKLIAAAANNGHDLDGAYERDMNFRAALDACTVIEVPAGATHFARKADERDHDYPLPKGCDLADCVIEEIPGI